MMRRYTLFAVAAVFGLAFAIEPAAAQVVQVNPGFVRAPFVRVYRDADGGTHVQAPYVNRYVPGRNAPNNRWNRDPRNVATRDDLRQMPDARLRRQLFGAALDLDRALNQFETGATWQSYLKVAPGMPLSRDRFDDADQARTTGELASLLTRFDAVSRNADYRMIAALPAFQWTHELLAEYLDARRVVAPTVPKATVEELPPPQPLDPLAE